MNYVIPAVLLIVIFALVLFLAGKKKKKPQPQDTAALGEPVEEESIAKPGAEPGDEAAAAEFREEAGQETEEGMPPAEEEFVELSFDSQESPVEEEAGEEFIELSLDMEEKAATEEEAVETAAGEAEDGLHVTPALADSMEESEVTVGETPDELTEKLDYYFGEEEEDILSAGEETAGEAEEEILLEEPLAEPETPDREPAEEIAEFEEPAGLTRDSFADDLRTLEAEVRQDLREAIEKKDAGQRVVLEMKLQAVCEKLAGVDDNLTGQRQLIDKAERMLRAVQDEALQKDLPGIDVEETVRQLHSGNSGQVEAALVEAVLQLADESELVAGVYHLCGQLAEARLDYESAFEDYRNATAAEGENDEYLLAAGRIARILGKDSDAKSWLDTIVRMGLEAEGQTLIQAEAQHELGRICMREGQKEKAGALFIRALEIRKEIQGEEHADLGPLMHDYAVLFESNGMYEQAEELYTGALGVMEKNLGSSHPRLAATLNRLAGLYEELEEGDKALPLYEKALAIREQVLGSDHYDVGTILNSLADLLRRRGRLEEAEAMFKRSLAIAEKELGKDHPNLTVVLNNLAELYSQMGREEEAAQYQERAFSLFELPGMDGDFVEMEKDQTAIGDEKDTTIAGK